jgi:hypothetical protein
LNDSDIASVFVLTGIDFYFEQKCECSSQASTARVSTSWYGKTNLPAKVFINKIWSINIQNYPMLNMEHWVIISGQ